MLYDLVQQQLVNQFIAPDSVFCLSFTPDGGYLAIASTDIRMIDVATGRRIVTFGEFDVPGKRYECLAFTPNGDALFAYRDGIQEYGLLNIWDTRLIDHPPMPQASMDSPDGLSGVR